MIFGCSSDEESSQVFIPFVSDVRVNSENSSTHAQSVDMDESSMAAATDTSVFMGSPSQISYETSIGGGVAGVGSERKLSPPSSPHFSKDK